MASISLLFGLGNPGADYRHTRHNIGRDTLATLACRHGLSWKPIDEIALRCRWRHAGRWNVLLQSLTYMNLSGRVLEACRDVRPETLITVCDDINLPLGRLRIRRGGGSGGHRGLESIIDSVGTEEFPRLRMGIGAPEGSADLTDYVLSSFDDEERPTVDEMVQTAADALEVVVRDGIEEAMQRYNRRNIPPS